MSALILYIVVFLLDLSRATRQMAFRYRYLRASKVFTNLPVENICHSQALYMNPAYIF